VNWNGTRDTIECVASLREIDYPSYEVIIVDNGSSSQELNLLHDKIVGGFQVVELKRNLGFATANNVGIRKALQKGAEFVLLLNNDTVVERRFLKELVLAAGDDVTNGILGSKMYYYDNKDTLWYAGGKLNMYFGHRTQGLLKKDRGQFKSTKSTDYVAGACMLIRKEVFRSIGLLSREYFLGWEDIDFCVAAKTKGYKSLFVPSSIIWHKASASFKRHNLNYQQVIFGFRNRIIIRYKFLKSFRFCLFFLIQLFLVIPIHLIYYLVIYRDVRRIRSMFKGLVAGLKDMRQRRILYRIDDI
jgi:GT2 family glycosyltransferase